MRWIAGSAVHGCWLGSYESDKQDLFARTVQRGDAVYDIGANVGFYTLLSSVLAGPSGVVYAFEPLPRNIELLKKHLLLNHIANVQVIESAVADKPGTASFELSGSALQGKLGGDPAATSITVNVVSLDQIVAERNLRLPRLMKVDVEGAEYDVLVGAEHTIKSARPVIFLATHGADVHRRCCQWLRDHGYSLTALGGESVERTDEILAEPA
jgi:FkbM family methyltransferase